MSKHFLPLDDPPGEAHSKDDDDYAQHFGDIARVLEASTDAERLMLRLSTCRNVYMTVNSLFVDIRQVLGHGKYPSLLTQAIAHLRRAKHSDLNTVLGHIRERLATYQAKRKVWERRRDLDENLLASVGSLNDRLLASRVKRILEEVRTHAEGNACLETWDARWYALSQEEGDWAADKLTKLDSASDTIDALVTAMRAIASFRNPGGPTLFDAEAGAEHVSGWQSVYQVLAGCGARLTLLTYGDQADCLAWHSRSGEECRLPMEFTSAEHIGMGLNALFDHFEELERDLYDRLSSAFRPNVGRAPLPPPFVVDVTDSLATRLAELDLRNTLSVVETREFGRQAPPNITVAVCDFGIPASYYESRLYRYVNDERRREVANVARACVETTSKAKAAVLVLPEIFLPSCSADDIARLAREKGVALIAGVEPTTTDGSQHLVNQAIIALPGVAVIKQQKRRNSPYEHTYRYEKAGIHVLGGTSLGAFAVLVCSDLREFDVVAAIAGARFLIDTLFVCSFNPHPELFESFAITDAVRLYCHVVIANNLSAPGSAAASAQGTLVCSPMTEPADRIQKAVRQVALGVPQVGDMLPSLKIYELGIEDLRSEKEKPAKKYINCPHFRRAKPYV
jgi:predicted amidohydrolase